MLHGDLFHVEAVRFTTALRHPAEVNRHGLLRYGTLIHLLYLMLQLGHACRAVVKGMTLRRRQVAIPLSVRFGNLQLGHL